MLGWPNICRGICTKYETFKLLYSAYWIPLVTLLAGNYGCPWEAFLFTWLLFKASTFGNTKKFSTVALPKPMTTIHSFLL